MLKKRLGETPIAGHGILRPRSARVPRAGEAVPASRTWIEKIVSARRRNQHARRARHPEISA